MIARLTAVTPGPGSGGRERGGAPHLGCQGCRIAIGRGSSTAGRAAVGRASGAGAVTSRRPGPGQLSLLPALDVAIGDTDCSCTSTAATSDSGTSARRRRASRGVRVGQQLAVAGDGQLSLLPECLDERDRSVLAFAREHHLQGTVADWVQVQLGISDTRYYQLLVGLLERAEAEAAEPELIGQLRALRERRQRLHRR